MDKASRRRSQGRLSGPALWRTVRRSRHPRFGLAGRPVLLAETLWVCAAGLVGWGVSAAAAQDDSVETLHAYTNLMEIPALVLDRNGQPPAPIAADRFFVSIDGGPRFPVTHVRPEGDEPISLAILLDVSQPFPRLMEKIDDAIAGLAPLLHARDRVSIYTLDCKLSRSADNVPADPETLRRDVGFALQEWKAHGRDRYKSECKEPWNLWDALAVMTQVLHQQPGWRVALAVTDGEDRGSVVTWQRLQQLAQQRSVAIFGLTQWESVNQGNLPGSQSPMAVFSRLCGSTGGLAMTASEKDLAERLRWFTTLVRGRYIVEFPHPVDTHGEFHDMDITVVHSNATVVAAGIAVPKDDPAILNNPLTIPPDPSHMPQEGNRKAASPD